MRSTLIVLSLAALVFSGCSILSGIGKRETKFEEPPAYFSVPPAERKAAAPTGAEPLVTPQSANSLPWLMSDRAKEISSGIDAKHQ